MNRPFFYSYTYGSMPVALSVPLIQFGMSTLQFFGEKVGMMT